MPTILLAQEDTKTREDFTALILDFFPTTKIQPLACWEALEPGWAAATPVSVLLTDVLWEEVDRSDEILLLAEKYPETAVAIFGRYDLTGSLPPGYPIPLVVPDDDLPLRLAEWMENLSGREVGPYHITSPAGPHPLGRLYWCKHHQLQRSVQMLVPPAGSPGFSEAIRALARLSHPAVFSLYESIPWENRILVALEPVRQPSLLHFRLSGQKPSILACARLATALGSVLAEMESTSVPARLLGEYDYTLSPKELPRLRNPAAYPKQPETSMAENARQLAAMLESQVQGQPRWAPLLHLLRNPGTSAFDLLRQTREFERQLAEVREVHVRKEEREAAEKMLKARVIRRWAIGVGSVLLAAFLVIYARVIFQTFFFDAPGLLPETELAVPAGTILRDGQPVEVGAFFLDRHEVTIGEYEKFLAAIRQDPRWTRFLPPEALDEKKSPADLEPRDWGEILRRARKQQAYQAQKINRDTPVFNVDFASAVTFARWRGRRLPTLEEWLHASGGEGRRYPWGNEARAAPANLGLERQELSQRDPGDSYFNAAPGESFPGDRGPYGHFDLGGNLSEWAVGPFQNPVALGGNFTDPEPIPWERARRQDGHRGDPPAGTRLEVIGFRTAR